MCEVSAEPLQPEGEHKLCRMEPHPYRVQSALCELGRQKAPARCSMVMRQLYGTAVTSPGLGSEWHSFSRE